jgi:hypothetical protein
VITRREAVLRTLAVTGLCGLALVALAGLPAALGQGPQVAVLPGAAIAGAAWLGHGLATAEAAASVRAAWRATIALGVLAGGGSVAARGLWTTGGLGLVGAAVAAVLVALGVASLGGTRGLRTAAAALAVGAALAPAVATAVAALGPRPAHAADIVAGVARPHAAHAGHVTHAARASGPSVAGIRPGFGGHTGHYVYANVTPPHLPRWALALALGIAATAVVNAAGALRRRTVADPPGGMEALTRSGRAALYR